MADNQDLVRAHLSAAGKKGAASRWGTPEQRARTAREREEALTQLAQDVMDELRALRVEIRDLRREKIAA
jgi:hypothetical protein